MVCSWRSDQNTKPFGRIPQPSLSSVRTEPCELFWILSQHSLKKPFVKLYNSIFLNEEKIHIKPRLKTDKSYSVWHLFTTEIKKTNFAASLNLLNQWRSINTEVGGNISNILFHGTVFHRYQIIVPTVSQYIEIYRIVSPYRDTNLITRFSSTHCCLQIGFNHSQWYISLCVLQVMTSMTLWVEPGDTTLWLSHIRLSSLSSVAQPSPLWTVDLGGDWTSQIPNANTELSAAVPLDPGRRRLSLLLTPPFVVAAAAGAKQDGRAGARQGFGGPDEKWTGRIAAGQERLGVEPVLCAGGVHGLRTAVCGEGKENKGSFLLLFMERLMSWITEWRSLGKKLKGCEVYSWSGFRSWTSFLIDRSVCVCVFLTGSVLLTLWCRCRSRFSTGRSSSSASSLPHNCNVLTRLQDWDWNSCPVPCGRRVCVCVSITDAHH